MSTASAPGPSASHPSRRAGRSDPSPRQSRLARAAGRVAGRAGAAPAPTDRPREDLELGVREDRPSRCRGRRPPRCGTPRRRAPAHSPTAGRPASAPRARRAASRRDRADRSSRGLAVDERRRTVRLGAERDRRVSPRRAPRPRSSRSGDPPADEPAPPWPLGRASPNRRGEVAESSRDPLRRRRLARRRRTIDGDRRSACRAHAASALRQVASRIGVRHGDAIADRRSRSRCPRSAPRMPNAIASRWSPCVTTRPRSGRV